MSFTTAIVAIVIGSLIGIGLLWPWFEDAKELPELKD
jgi:hypothetical protein